MPITPEEIEEKEFLITLRGYDKDEVKAFLDSIAADMREVLDVVKGSGNPYQALGREVGEVLEVAKQTAEGIRGTAREEAAALRRKTQEEAAGTRQSADEASKRVREDAERFAVEKQAKAEREAEDKIHDAQTRVQKLHEIEARIRSRLDSLENMMRNVREDLGQITDEDIDIAVAGTPEPAPPPPPEPESRAEPASEPLAESGGNGASEDAEAALVTAPTNRDDPEQGTIVSDDELALDQESSNS